ncbi:MAG TPA: TolC family protein [Planctomycetota bacterium]|nr:TolC family protein [Planctomycetota bacterium]
MTASQKTRLPLLTLSLLTALPLFGACATDQQADVDLWRREVALGDTPAFVPGTPLSLATAVRLANDQNERIAIAGEDFVQACAERARINADFFPQVDLAPSFIYREKTNSGVKFLDQSSLLDVPVHAQWTPFDGFRTVNLASAADLTAEQRRSLLLDLRETVVLEVAQAYYRVLRAERRAELLEQSIATQEQRVRDFAARERIGTARTLDRTQAEALVSRTRLDLFDTRADALAARQALSLLTGADVHDSPLHDDFVLPSERPDGEALLALAAQRRQDLQAAALAAEAARARVEVAFGQYYPSIGVSVDWFLSRASLPTERDWTGLLSLYLPLFSAGRIAAEVREAWSQFRQEVSRYSLLRRTIEHDLAVALDQLATLDQRLDELKTLTAADAESLRQAEASSRAGLGTNLVLLLAQNQLQRSQVDVAETELERKVAWLGTLRITGALTAGTVDVPLPAPPPPRPVPVSPFVLAPSSD